MASQHHSDEHQRKEQILSRIYSRLTWLAVLCLVCVILTVSACGSGEDSNAAQLTTAPVQTPPIQTEGGQSTSGPTDTQTAEPTTGNNSHADSHAGVVIRYTDSNDDIWPPQPVNITDVAAVQRVADVQTSPEKSAKIVQALRDIPVLRKTPGNRYQVLASHEVRNKSNLIVHIETEIYFYDTDLVVTMKHSNDSDTIISHSVSEAINYQPPESQAEVKLAIELAKAALTQQGYTDHLLLTGTGLLAYPTATESATTGQKFFAQRKIYVTFGTGNGELPQYRALVNLSTSTVEQSGAIQ